MNLRTATGTILGLAMLTGSAFAKLPAPNDEAKAKAAEAAAKTAHAGKVDNYKLCLSMDKVGGQLLRQCQEGGQGCEATRDDSALRGPRALRLPAASRGHHGSRSRGACCSRCSHGTEEVSSGHHGPGSRDRHALDGRGARRTPAHPRQRGADA